ncbi:hypothetical protein ABZ281_49130, partial [Streptomyces sp. NPDC006265]
MHSNMPELSDSELLAIADRAAKRTPVKPSDLLILSALQLELYRELHAAAGQLVRPSAPAEILPAAQKRVRRAINAILAESEEMAVFRQIYDHVANAALSDRRVAEQLKVLSGSQQGPGGAFLKRMLRFAAADAYPNTVQMLVVDFLRTTEEQTLRAVLAQFAGMEWALDPDDRHQRTIIDPPDVIVDSADAEIRRFRELGLGPGEVSPGRSLARSDSAAWETPDEHRIRIWRRRYVEAHRQSLDWARAKAEVYRRERER